MEAVFGIEVGLRKMGRKHEVRFEERVSFLVGRVFSLVGLLS